MSSQTTAMSRELTVTTPSAERSLNRQIVLEEDEYTSALSHIIARDFFPSLVHLDATNDYLDALHSRDPHLISASVRRLEEINETPAATPYGKYQTPSQTPYSFEPSQTPARTPRGEAPYKRLRYDTSLSLDNFQARYTSEDNSSFTRILDDENLKRKEKWGWAWEAQKRVEKSQQKMIEARQRMLVEGPSLTGVREKFMLEPAPLAKSITGLVPPLLVDGEKGLEKHKENDVDRDNASILTPEQHEAEDVMAPKKDTRTASVDGWRFMARNSLMFPPDADISPYDSLTSSLSATVDPRTITYGNTRLPEQNHYTSSSRGTSAPPSPTRSRIEAAITGTAYHPSSSSEDGFSLVPNLPSPTPSELGPAAVKQLMTWGTLNATPRIISKPDELPNLPPPSTPFHIPDISSREVMSRKLADHASKSLRAKAGLLGRGFRPGLTKTPARIGKTQMAPPPWTPRRSEAAGNLTPAGRRLLERSTLGTAALRRSEVMERTASWDGNSNTKESRDNRVRWTPTPSPVTRR